MKNSTKTSGEVKKIGVLVLILVVLVIVLGVGYLFWQNRKAAKVPSEVAKPNEEISKEAKGGLGEEGVAGWKTYQIVPAPEEAAEPRQAVAFSLSYPPEWTYRILDEEIRATGAPVYDLHFVAFGDPAVSSITQTENSVVVFANSHLFPERLEIEKNAYGREGVLSNLPSGEKVVKFVGKKVSPIGEAEEETVTVIVEPPADWTLVIEGKKQDEVIIDQIVKSLKF